MADANGTPLVDNAGQRITTVTDADGFYQFRGLLPGVYSVLEVQPTGYVDGRDTAGAAGGVALNPGDKLSKGLLDEVNAASVPPAKGKGKPKKRATTPEDLE